jgi:hypothetical protein
MRPLHPTHRLLLAWSLALLWALAGCVSVEPLAGKPCQTDEDCGQGLECEVERADDGRFTGVCRSARPGKLGDACDPETGAPCRELCLLVPGQAAQCTTACDPQDPVACPTGYVCGRLLGAAAADPSYCTPNQDCQGLTAQGLCDGTVLEYCDRDGPVSFDCATLAGPDGAPMRCDLVSQEHGHDCVSSEFTRGCGEVTQRGLCRLNTVVFCESAESGVVREVPCGSNEECFVGEDRVARCRALGSEGCGDITYQGRCEGDTAVWCEDSQVMRHDCASDEACGFVDNEIGYWCSASGGNNGGLSRVSGRFRYERPLLTENGLGRVQTRPVRRALVQVRREGTDQILSSGVTRDDGTFELPYQGAGQVYVLVWASTEGEDLNMTVRDCPMADCDDDGAVYAARTRAYNGGQDIQLEELTLPVEGVAGAFNILDVMLQGADAARAWFGSYPPPVVAQWRKGSNTRCGTSCYALQSNTLFILGVPEDTDEFDDPVLGHEFGHFLEASFSRTDSPGGFHDGSPTDPRLAWGEGYGTFVGGLLFGSPLYLDSFATGASVYDLSASRHSADPDASRGISQLLSEFVVAEVLWEIVHGGPASAPLGSEPVFDVLGRYLPSGRMVDRGVRGVDLVDFLDGWFCRGHGEEREIERNVNQLHGFPYDYAGPQECP